MSLRMIVLLAIPCGLTGASEGTPRTHLVPRMAGALEQDFAAGVTPVLEEHCIDCHSEPKPKAGLDLSSFVDEVSALAHPQLWHEIRGVLAKNEMPPSTIRSRPEPAEIDAVIGWIDRAIERGALPEISRPPGRTTLRRLNRLEYRNAILDLFGVDFPAREWLPADGVAHGFDVIGDVLSMPPILFEKYFEAAELVAASALPVPGVEGFAQREFSADELQLSDPEFLRAHAKAVWMFTNGSATAVANISRPGEYLLRFEVGATQAGPDPARFQVSVDRRKLGQFEVSATPSEPETFEVSLPLEPGEHRFTGSFINDYYEPSHPNPDRRDRNLSLSGVSLVGPVDQPIQTDFEVRYLQADPASPRLVVEELARLAWRGEADSSSIDALLEIAEPEADDRERIRSALTGILTSPRFLFRVEPEPEEPSRELESRELATRLAAFLWSSVPDALLLDLADTGELAMPSVISAQVDRMLRDARATRLSVTFAEQWLQLRRFEQSTPDPQHFPDFDEELRSAMKSESELFFESVLREDRPVSELLTAEYTFANERLAKHYGLPGVDGPHMRRVAIPPRLVEQRAGILGQGAVLTATSNPNRTSPVRRGKWVLEALFATPPSPPPPGVDSLDESLQAASNASVRQRLEQHRADPDCAVCHAPMDGYGLALERFDAVGVWRDLDGKFEIDDSAELPGGVRFSGPGGLRETLLGDRAFLKGLLRHLLTFALGRGLVEHDEQAIDRLLTELPRDPSLKQVIIAVTETEAFRTRYREAEQS